MLVRTTVLLDATTAAGRNDQRYGVWRQHLTVSDQTGSVLDTRLGRGGNYLGRSEPRVVVGVGLNRPGV